MEQVCVCVCDCCSVNERRQIVKNIYTALMGKLDLQIQGSLGAQETERGTRAPDSPEASPPPKGAGLALHVPSSQK